MAWKLKGGKPAMRRSSSWLCGEARVVVVDQRPVQRMVGIFGLDQHFAGQVGAAAAAADLHQLREQPLRGAEVGGEQRRIGADRADQGQQREIVALGQHLGADQDVGLAGVDGGEQACHFSACSPSRGRCAARGPAGKRSTSMASRRCVPRPKGSRSTLPQSGRRAECGLEAAVVAAQALVGQVQHEVGGAAPAARDPAAGRAGQHRRIAAPVEEDQALLAALEALCSPASSAALRPSCNFSRRVSTMRTTGMASATARSGSSSIW
jgi:hypothetical protein